MSECTSVHPISKSCFKDAFLFIYVEAIWGQCLETFYPFINGDFDYRFKIVQCAFFNSMMVKFAFFKTVVVYTEK